VTCGGSPVGTDRCSGVDSQTCDPSGQWATVQTCQYVCSGLGVCGGSCTPGAKQCSGLESQVCSAEGQWVQDQTCPYVCSGAGVCSGVCTPGQTQCGTLGVETCSAAGQWATTQTCGAGPQQDATCTMVGTQATCGVECQAGWSDCDGVAANGCEADLDGGFVAGINPDDTVTARYPTNCGACGRDCSNYGSGSCQVGICQGGSQATDISWMATGFTVTPEDHLWVIQNHATLWYAQAPRTIPGAAISGHASQVASSALYLHDDPILDPANNQNPCVVAEGGGVNDQLACLSGGNLVAETTLGYNNGMIPKGMILQSDRVLMTNSLIVQEIARGSSAVLQLATTSDQTSANLATPTDNYYTIRLATGTTLYRSVAHSTAKQVIWTWPAGWKVNQLAYQGRYVVWLAGLNDYPEIGTYDTLTGLTNVLYSSAMYKSFSMAVDSQWVYFTSDYGSNIYRVAITGGTPELRVAGITPGTDRTLKVSNNYLYWLYGNSAVQYQSK
jgi:hypothetical protein